jgi:hypothetical protein
MVSFARPDQICLAAEISQTFALDNGAFTHWRNGTVPDWQAYSDWVDLWGQHPGFDFAIIPDVVEGTEEENDALIQWWYSKPRRYHAAPVWHMHESLSRLEILSWNYPWRVALGSSGEFATVGTPLWWSRMSDAMKVVCDKEGRPRCKLHGLRMLNPTIFSHLPLSSADSTNVARNIGLDDKWDGPYCPRSYNLRALVLADRIEKHASASRWSGMVVGIQENLELVG